MNANAEEGGGDIKTFWGLARPPTSYGAYAGGDQKNAKCASQMLQAHMGEKRNACNYQCMVLPQPTSSLLSKPYRLLMCRYVFDYPPSWKVETVGKVIILQGQMVWMAHQCSVYHGMKVIVSDKALAMQNEKGMQGIDCRVRNKTKGRLSWRALQEALRSLDMLWR